MLDWTGERYVPDIDPSICGAEIHYEHLHRYAFASQFTLGKTVLDLACGEGYGTFILSKNALSVVGIEINPNVVLHAKNTYDKENIEFIEGSILNIPVEGEKLFDIIVCFEAIEHVKEHDTLLNEIKRLLKNEGLVIISTPDKKHYSEDTGYQNPFHMKELHRLEFSELLQKYFSYVYLSGQQVFSGSLIYPLSPRKNISSSEFIIRYEDKKFYFVENREKNPRYIVAIASNINLNPEPLQESYLVDKSNIEITLLIDKINSCNGSIRSLETIISNKENQIIQADNNIQSLETTISNKENQIIQADNNIQSLESRITELDSKILNLETHVHSLEDKMAINNQELITARKDLKLSNINLNARESEIVLLNLSIIQLKVEIYSLKNSISYRLLVKFHKTIVEPLLPPATKRRKLYDLGLQGGRIAISQGFGKAFSEYKLHLAFQKRVTDDFQIPLTVTEPEVNVEGTPDSPYNRAIIHLHTQSQQKSSEYIPFNQDGISLKSDDVKFIAFYLPQFHPIPENDHWWGKGFTEWTNVTKALPQFIGHYQPHLPGELGFYDLRLPEIQKRQVELAQHYGIYGFCFHYYWFNGKKLLERPLNQFIANKEGDFPFCICWANENWTRRWDGLEQEILISQDHLPENDISFIQDIEHLLRDPRYIRINGKPLVLVYRVTLSSNTKETTGRWRDYCKDVGIGDLYLVAALAFGCNDPDIYGFDAAVEFPPHTMNECNIITKKMKILNPNFSGNIYDFEDFVTTQKYRKNVPYRRFRTVSPGWDNTARRLNNASVYYGANPNLYKKWLSDVTRLTKETHPQDEQFVFINAWNEWAEGAHLEPDRKFGYGFLQATSDVILETREPAESAKKKIIVVSHDAHLHGAQMLALHIVKVLTGQFHYEVHLLLKSGGVLEIEFRKFAFVYNLEKEYPNTESINKLLEVLQQKGISIAICNTVVTGDIVKLLSNNRIRTLSLIHELPGVIRQFGQEENAKRIAHFADRVIFPAEIVKEKFSDITDINEEKCSILPQGLFLNNRYKNCSYIARTKLREIFSLPANSKIVLNVGYADSRKGIDLFVKVAEKVITEFDNVWFVWVGMRDETLTASIDAEIKRSGLAKKILFPGIRRDDIDIFYSGSDIFLLTSREDPFPSVVLDAMNARLAVVGFADAGGFEEVISETTGILVTFLSIEKMADAVLQILKDPELQINLGTNASDLIDRKFYFPDYIYALLNFIGEDYKKISVILPSYNYEHYLPKRLESIFGQTYPIYEIIAIDDNSKDQSVEILERFADKAPVHFKVIVNSENSGSVFRQWAKGIKLSRGDFVWIAEADDLSEKQFLEEVMKGFNDNSVVLSYSQSKQIDQNETIIAQDYCNYTIDVDPDKWSYDYSRPGIDEICDSLAIKNTIPNVSAVVFKKIDISGIVEDLVHYKIAGDWFFYICLLKTGSVSYFARPLNLHRRHKKSVTKSENAHQHFNEIVAVQEYVKGNFNLEPSIQEKVRLYRQFIHTYLLE